MPTQNRFDVAIVGAGVVGSMIARELSRFSISIVVLDKESDVGAGSSSSNSAIIHSGHDPLPGSLKAKLNVRGNRLWRSVARDLDIPLKATGALVVARDGQEEQLHRLLERAKQNGVDDAVILDREEVLRREPNIRPDIVGALWTPSAMVVDPFQGVLGPAENAAANGVSFRFEHTVTDALIEDGHCAGVMTDKGPVYATFVVNACGVHADEIMHLFGVHPDFLITARRGEYFVFDPSRFNVSNVIFPMPDERGKGILVTTTTHGNSLIGPNSEEVEDKEDQSVTESGMHQILEGAARLVPSVSATNLIAAFAGLRATGNYKPDGRSRDFLIEHSSELPGLINVAGIESPGFASSPAIAEMVVELIKDAGLNLPKKKEWQQTRVRPKRFHHMSHDERAERVAENSAYGRIVCRCENVTEAEIVEAIHRPIPARTYDAIKRRTWLGTGRCQGGFDYPRTMEILARELGTPMTAVTKKGPGSEFLYRPTKEAVS